MKNLSILLLLVVFSLVGLSCTDELNSPNTDDSNQLVFETSVESFFEDVDGLVSSLSFLSDAGFFSRTSKIDERLCDDTILKIFNKNKLNPDTLSVDFGAVGCSDAKGNVRKGKIIITYSGDRKLGGTTFFSDFYLNGKKIEGVRSVELVKLLPPTFNVSLVAGKVTWPDGTFATRESSHFREWNPNLNEAENSFISILKGGKANGINRDGKQFRMEITDDLVFKRSCIAPPNLIMIPVSGMKEFKFTNAEGLTKTIIVDFGDGACDKNATVTIDGKTKDVVVGGD